MSVDAYVLPTSFAQRRMWFLHQLVPDSPFYNIHVALPLDFSLDFGVLRRTLDEMVRRHEVLRTTFVEESGTPVQVVADVRTQELPVRDLRTLEKAERGAEVRRLSTEAARQIFDLRQGPLLRTTLLVLGEREHLLLITIHHIISDAWSMGVFFKEVGALYEAFAGGQASPLPDLPLQYADFAEWQQEWLAGDVLAAQLDYWRGHLGDLPVLDLPTDRPRPAIPSFKGACHRFQIGSALVEDLGRLVRRAECTPFMGLLAVYAMLLHRYADQDDIVVGAPIANRNHVELEGLIGFFVNTMVLRIDLSGDPTVLDLLARVREAALGAYAHQDIPFEKLVEELHPERDLSRNPMFQTSFQLHNEPGSTAADEPASSANEAERGNAPFDVVFDLWRTGSGITGSIDFATDLFDAATIVRFAGHYRQLLRAAVLDPDQRISELEMLTDVERRSLLIDRNDTDRDYPRDATIADLFEEQAAATPDAPAVMMGERTLSYGALDALANRVARGLVRRGVGPDTPVAICVDRSLELVVGLLGILKAGGAYVALDPGDPLQRRDAILADADIGILLTRGHLRAALESARAGLLALDLEGGDFEGEDSGPLELATDERATDEGAATTLAYIAFTSGSTGRPKGVCIPQRAVVRLVRNNPYAEFGPAEVFLQFSPVAFDASTFEIWGALLNGGTLVVHPPEAPSLEQLGAVIRESGVTTLWLTAGLFHQMVDERLDDLVGVRQLLAGGDVLSAGHVRKLLDQPGQRRVVNGYGPTEGTTFTACYAMTAASDVPASVPIGKPIANTRVYVLDRAMNPAPVGVPGELYIGGDGVARGYLNLPDETESRFVNNPFRPGERLYRTGDRVRWRAEGGLDFLGRRDRQVKVRGYRVEPGEAEAALAEHPDVRDAVVVPMNDPSGQKRLHAYIVPETGREPDHGELDAFLRARLPSYLMPAGFVFLDEFPLTPNGKLDLAALPDPGGALNGTGDRTAPRNEIEEAVALMWREVLGVSSLGVHDNFFADVGGHSLMGTLLVSRIRQTLGIDLPLRVLFEAPTVAGQALVIEDMLLTELEGLSENEARILVES